MHPLDLWATRPCETYVKSHLDHQLSSQVQEDTPQQDVNNPHGSLRHMDVHTRTVGHM